MARIRHVQDRHHDIDAATGFLFLPGEQAWLATAFKGALTKDTAQYNRSTVQRF